MNRWILPCLVFSLAACAEDASFADVEVDLARQESAAETGDDGDGSSQAAVAVPPPKCMKRDSQLIVIGDSYITWLTHSFPQDIAAVSGQRWRMEAVGGYSMATGGLGLIPPLFDNSIARNPDAHTVLMDGGGNDVLLGDLLGVCKNDNAPNVAFCQKLVADALAAAESLMLRMANKGIRDVVYFFYPHVPKNTILGGANPNAILDYALPKIQDFCASVATKTSGKLRCHFVDMVPVFEGKPQNQWFFPGDIHPTSVGSKAMAEAVWAKMKEQCIGQKESSGCCEP